MIEIVHFLLGGSIGKESLFKAKASFWGDFRFKDIDFRVERPLPTASASVFRFVNWWPTEIELVK